MNKTDVSAYLLTPEAFEDTRKMEYAIAMLGWHLAHDAHFVDQAQQYVSDPPKTGPYEVKPFVVNFAKLPDTILQIVYNLSAPDRTYAFQKAVCFLVASANGLESPPPSVQLLLVDGNKTYLS